MIIKRRSDASQSRRNSLHGETDGSQKFELSNTNQSEDYDAKKSDDSQCNEGEMAAQSSQRSIRFPFSDHLEDKSPLDTVIDNTAPKPREHVHQQIAQLQATLSAFPAKFDELTEGNIVKVLLQSPSLPQDIR